MLNKNMIIALSIFFMSIFWMSTIITSGISVDRSDIPEALKANYAGPFFGINLPFGVESSAFIENVTQLAKMGFDSPQNAKLFIQLDSIALNSSSNPGNRTLTAPTIERLTSVYNQMKRNNPTGRFAEIASVDMQDLNNRSFFDGAGRNITVIPNSLDFSDILKFGTLGAKFVCGIGPNNSGDLTDMMKSGQCVAGAFGAAAVKLNTLI